MARWIYVDNSNLWIEGQRLSAVRKGMAPDIWSAMAMQVVDTAYRMDFGRLINFLANGHEIKGASLFGSRPPANDSLWNIAKEAGFETIINDRNAANKEKRIDTGIVARIVMDANVKCNKDEDEIILVAGDGDYVPVTDILVQNGYTVIVAFWNHASKDLKHSATTFIDLNPYLEYLTY